MKKKNLDDLNLKNEERPFRLKMNVGIEEKDRKKISEGLSGILADSYCLMIMLHNYHWNVKGKNFRQIHLLTEEQYTELFAAIDEIAERIRSLGYLAPGSITEFADLSHIGQPDSKGSENKMLADLLEAHEHIAKHARQIVVTSDEVNDEATSDLLTGRIEQHEKAAWMLRSMLEN
jgi:starvation-inducible DNA-binding protein